MVITLTTRTGPAKINQQVYEYSLEYTASNLLNTWQSGNKTGTQDPHYLKEFERKY